LYVSSLECACFVDVIEFQPIFSCLIKGKDPQYAKYLKYDIKAQT